MRRAGLVVLVCSLLVSTDAGAGQKRRATPRKPIPAAPPKVEPAQVKCPEPLGVGEQPPLLNGAVELETTLTARELLDQLHAVEQRFGRVRIPGEHGPRTLDLDLLLYGDETIDEPGLTVPHPRVHERRFVLEPLAELAPGLVVPGRGDMESLLRGVH